MNTKSCQEFRDYRNILQRAATVREGWSVGEHNRRRGLPPDMPWRLREHLTERSTTRAFVAAADGR